jgi:hypothetical protein
MQSPIKVLTFERGPWLYLFRFDKPFRSIAGKYLFFCPDSAVLVGLAEDLLQNHGFQVAKLPVAGSQVNGDYVLCVYYENDSRKRDLADVYREYYKENPTLRYRYWKADSETSAGQYSALFLLALTPEQREVFDSSGA